MTSAIAHPFRMHPHTNCSISGWGIARIARIAPAKWEQLSKHLPLYPLPPLSLWSLKSEHHIQSESSDRPDSVNTTVADCHLQTFSQAAISEFTQIKSVSEFRESSWQTECPLLWSRNFHLGWNSALLPHLSWSSWYQDLPQRRQRRAFCEEFSKKLSSWTGWTEPDLPALRCNGRHWPEAA